MALEKKQEYESSQIEVNQRIFESIEINNIKWTIMEQNHTFLQKPH